MNGFGGKIFSSEWLAVWAWKIANAYLNLVVAEWNSSQFLKDALFSYKTTMFCAVTMIFHK